jgi:hypothetical protein
MIGPEEIPNPIGYITNSITDCKTCHKAKRSFINWIFLMVNALGAAILSGLVFFFVGQYFGIEYYRLSLMIKLPMILSAAAYLWFVYWQFGKVFCECE